MGSRFREEIRFVVCASGVLIRMEGIVKTVFLFICIACAATCIAQGATSGTSDDEASIRAIVETIVSGWSKGEGSEVAAVYADDGTLVAGDGKVTRGRAEIAEYHDRLFAAFLKNTRLTVKVTRIHFLTAHIALMQTEGGILWPGESRLAKGNAGIQSFVVVKENGEWRIVLFQNTRVGSAVAGTRAVRQQLPVYAARSEEFFFSPRMFMNARPNCSTISA